MIEQLNIKNKSLFYLLFFVIALITFYPLFFTGFATADDFHYYLITRRGMVMQDTAYFAKFAGRFYFYIVKPIYNLPYLVDNMAVIKFFHFLPLVLCILYFARIINKLTGSATLSWLFLLLFFTTMQISRHTSLFVAYPFYFTFSFLLLLISYDLVLIYFSKKNRLFLWLAALVFFAGLLFFETYIFFLLFVFLTIWMHSQKSGQNFTGRVRLVAGQFFPFFLFASVYLTVYFVFRHYHPSQYSGTSIAAAGFSVRSFFKVIWKLSLTSFPLMVYENAHSVFWDKSDLIAGYSPIVLKLILSAKIEWLVKGILVAFSGFYLLSFAPSLSWKKLATLAAAGLLVIFIPHVPLALTEKYIFYVEQGAMIGYITTFFSLFGTLLFILMLLTALVKLASFNGTVRTIAVSVVIAGLFLISVITDFSNGTIAKDMRSANLRLYAVDELVKTDEFRSVPPKTPIFGKTMWDCPSHTAPNITEQDFNWSEYFEVRTGKIYPFDRDEKLFLDHTRYLGKAPYFMGIRQTFKSEEIALVMAKMDVVKPTDSVVNHYADRALVLYYSSYKFFTVSFKVRGDGQSATVPIRINNISEMIPVDKTIEFSIYNTHRGDPATKFIIEFPGIDLNSLIISDMVRMENKIFYL